MERNYFKRIASAFLSVMLVLTSVSIAPAAQVSDTVQTQSVSTRKYANIVVFVDFKDTTHEHEKTELGKCYKEDPKITEYFEGDEEHPRALKQYVSNISYGQLNVQNIIPQYDSENNKIEPYVLSNDVSYYGDRTVGTSGPALGDTRMVKEISELLAKDSRFPKDAIVDYDGDGCVDNLMIVTACEKGNSNSQMYGHKSTYAGTDEIPTIYRAAVNTINKKMHIKIGYYGASPNKQMEFDHRFDNALYLDGDFVERKLGALKSAYEKYSELAAVHGGPAVMEVFGETPFEPEDTIECCHLDDKQQKLLVKYNNESGSIINSYIKGEERSFTIIAYPSPQIGDKFPEIFNEIVKINTLDYEKYKVIQQNIINVLDKAEYVEVHGQGANETDMKVSIMKVNNPDKETVFENCLADVNIPLGEVFTSPVLKGTEGVLNVSSVYLNDIKFNNLKVYFKDGFVTDYSCDNFEDGMKGKALFKENVLYNHDTLPIGEFAIGTNTTAYVMANKYDIVYLLPILIVEKMGPHFAIGDTCYSRSEDVAVYNPDGKEIISRDNEVSLLRKTEPDKAYFNCHTDITIPYEEIGDITVVGYDGERTAIIKNGRFVLDGTKELNEPFEE